MNAPKLRFKEFNDEWKNKNLSELVSFSKGNLLSKSDLDENGVYPCILYGQLYTTYHEVIRKVYYKTNNNSKNITRSKYGDILIPSSGETPIDISTSSCLLLDNILLGGDINILSPINCDGRFISYMINNNKRTEIAKVAQGHSIVHLYNENLKKVNLQIPTMNEQIKVANTLELLDKKIEFQTKKIEDLKLFKKGLNDSIIFKNAGTISEISDLIVEYDKKTIINNQYPVLSSTINGITIQKDYFKKSASSIDTTGYKIVPNNYITYRSMSDTGQFHFNLQNIIDIGIVSPAYPVFKLNDNINLEYFLNYINNCKAFKNQILSIKEGGTRFALSFSKFNKLLVSIPEEQHMNLYGNILNKTNSKIQLEIEKLNKLQEIKKGLMQNMFV